MNPLSNSLASRAAKDSAVFLELYEQYFKRVYTYIRYRCDDHDTADDLTSEVFEHLLDCLGQYDPGRGPFEPWLFAVARNIVNAHYRRRRFAWLPWENMRAHVSADPLPEETVMRRERQQEILAALSGLDARSRDVLGLKFAAGLSSAEIAALSGLSESNFRVIVYRAVGKLRDRLAKPGRRADELREGKVRHE
jgi:RNA polymerase sigma factor (sigma-70 family)